MTTTTKIIAIPFFISIAVLSVAMGFAFAHFAHLDAQVILSFDGLRKPIFGTGQDVLSIILSGMVIVFINYLLAKGLRVREEFLSTILSVSSVFIAILILISIFVIIANN